MHENWHLQNWHAHNALAELAGLYLDRVIARRSTRAEDRLIARYWGAAASHRWGPFHHSNQVPRAMPPPWYTDHRGARVS